MGIKPTTQVHKHPGGGVPISPIPLLRSCSNGPRVVSIVLVRRAQSPHQPSNSSTPLRPSQLTCSYKSRVDVWGAWPQQERGSSTKLSFRCGGGVVGGVWCLCWVLMWVLLLGGVLSRLWEGVWVGSSISTLQSTSNVYTHSSHLHHTLSTHTPKIKSLYKACGSLWVHIHVQWLTSHKIHIIHSPRPNQGDGLVVLVGPRRGWVHHPQSTGRWAPTHPSTSSNKGHTQGDGKESCRCRHVSQ